MSRRALARSLSLSLVVALAVFSLSTAQAGPGTATVKKANDTVNALLGKNAAPGSKAEKRLVAQVTRNLRGFLDIDELGRLAMADHWAKLTEKQRTEYTTLLRKLIETSYVKGLRANLKYVVKYTGEAPKGKYLLVTTEIHTKRKGRPFTIGVDYLLRKSGRAWRTFDIITDGVGLVENYRAMFNKIIKKRGFDGLLQRMQRKLAKL